MISRQLVSEVSRMSSRSHWWLLLTPLAYACGGEGGSLPDLGELPYVSLPDAARPQPDAGSRPATRADAGTPGDPTPGDTQSDDDDPLTDDSACAASSVAAEQVVVEEQVEVKVDVTEPVPVALYVMLDRSQSMNLGGLWSPAVNALTSFVRDAANKDMEMAVEYFPSDSGQCSGAGYSTPALAMGLLSAQSEKIVSSMKAQSASGFGTPVEGALRGVTQFCVAYQAKYPNKRCVGVVVTDGKPEFDGCEHNSDKLVAIAGDAWTKQKVRTFAVGLKGADFGLLDRIATAGGAADCDASGTRFACDVSGGADKLNAALAKIRDTVTTTVTRTETQTVTKPRPLECEWKMPAPQGDSSVDINRVNVTVTGGSNQALQLGRVPGATACQPGAWYFDDASAPTRITACPQSCEAIKAGGYTDVKILLGCQTHILVI